MRTGTGSLATISEVEPSSCVGHNSNVCDKSPERLVGLVSLRRDRPLGGEFFSRGNVGVDLTMLLISVVHFEHECVRFFFVWDLADQRHFI